MISDTDPSEDWTVGKCAQVSVRLLSRATGNQILPHVLPFVQENLCSPEGRVQGAALSCLAGVLEGPEQEALIPLIHALTG